MYHKLMNTITKTLVKYNILWAKLGLNANDANISFKNGIRHQCYGTLTFKIKQTK